MINLKGRKPQALKDGEIYCGRNMYMGGWKLPASKWANPYKVDRKSGITLDDVIKKFRAYLEGNKALMSSLHELQGKVLACWCKPAKCHCDVLAQMANELEKEKEEKEKAKEEEKVKEMEVKDNKKEKENEKDEKHKEGEKETETEKVQAKENEKDKDKDKDK